MLFTMPTNMSTARVNARFRQRVTAQTCHSAFGFDEGVAMHSVLSWYTMTVTDEISQLQGWHYDHICRMWQLADKTSVVGTCINSLETNVRGTHCRGNASLTRSISGNLIDVRIRNCNEY